VGPPIREEITAYEPDRRLAYRALSGVPAKDYTGEITLEPTSTGTRLTWSLRFKPLFPGAQFGIAAFIRLAARSLAKEATRRGAGATR
jgi:carbon monoxide dehydrogenase subunit G